MKRRSLFFLLVSINLGLWLVMSLPLQAEENEVVLLYFLAEIDPVGVRLEWATESEIDMIGFQIKRADHSAGPYETIDLVWEGQTVNFVPALGMPPTGGAVYEVWDVAAAGGQVYWYMLVAVELGGSGEYGPVSAISGSVPTPKLFLPLLSTP